MCLFNGRKHWFHCIGDPDDGERIFNILYLTDEQIEKEDERHALWVKHVGGHCDYDEHNKRCIGDLKPRSEWNKYYSVPHRVREYSQVVKVVTATELKKP